MARLPRLSLAGLPHLAVQRGHNHQAVFLDDTDRATFMTALRDAAARHAVAVHGYALTDEAVWLLVTPVAAADLSLLMQAVGRRYVQAFNRRHRRSGTLWDGRFRATVLDPATALAPALCFVEQAPVRSGAVAQAPESLWSSAAHHVGSRRDPLVSSPAGYWAYGNTPFEREHAWRRRLAEALGPAEQRRISEAVNRGRPLGDGAFLAQVMGRLDRPLPSRPRGRLKKVQSAG